MKKIRRWRSCPPSPRLRRASAIARRVREGGWAAIVYGFVAVTLGGFRNNAWSEDVAPPAVAAAPSALEQRVDQLDRQVKTLQQQVQSGQTVPAATTSGGGLVVSGPEGYGLKSADGNFSLQLHGLLQADSRFFLDDKANTEVNQFLIRRLRPILTGTLYNFYSFRFTPEYASNGKVLVYDAYLDIAPWPFAKLRVGKFKPPIGAEHLQDDANLAFAERGLTNNLSPQRDTGLQLFGDFWNGAVGYAAAVTNGVGDGNYNTLLTAPVTSDTDNNNGKEETGRITVNPFKNTDIEALKGFGVALAGSYAASDQTNPTYATPGQITTSIYTPAGSAVGEHSRLAPDLSWYYGPLGIYSEYIRSRQDWQEGTHKYTVTNTAGQIGVRYVLTGEKVSANGVKPAKVFDPSKGTWGALEVAARYEQLYLDPANYTDGIAAVSTSVQRAQAYAFGFNWYLNSAVRFTTDYEETTFDKGAAVGDRPNEKVVISRWQITF